MSVHFFDKTIVLDPMTNTDFTMGKKLHKESKYSKFKKIIDPLFNLIHVYELPPNLERQIVRAPT